MQQAFAWSASHPGTWSSTVLAGTDGAFFEDHANPNFLPAYRNLLFATGLCRHLAALIESANLWLLYEQIWIKPQNSQATPWHQDLPYIPMSGRQLVNAWIPLDPVDSNSALKFLIGSHTGPLYNPPTFNASDPNELLFFDDGRWPPFPSITETESAPGDAHLVELRKFPKSDSKELKWLVRTPVNPSDVVVFHPAIVHGGGETTTGQVRRSISLRFFGDDAVVADRPETGAERDLRKSRMNTATSSPIDRLADARPGTPFRDPGFLAVVDTTKTS